MQNRKFLNKKNNCNVLGNLEMSDSSIFKTGIIPIPKHPENFQSFFEQYKATYPKTMPNYLEKL